MRRAPPTAPSAHRARLLTPSLPLRSDQVIKPTAPLALRLQAMLLRGIVALYTRQLQFLYDDAQSGLARLQSHLDTSSGDAKHVLETKKQAAKCVQARIVRPRRALTHPPGPRRCSASWIRSSSSS